MQPIQDTNDDPKLEGVLFYQLEQTMRQSIRYTNGVLERAGADLTKDQWLVLKKVNDEAEVGVSPFEMAKVLGKEAASMTRMLDILERKQMLVRKPNPNDRRSSLIYPTAAGKKVYQKLLPLVIEIRRQAVAGLSPEEVRQLRQMLIKMQANLT